MRAFLFAAALSLASAPALAGQAVTLKADTLDTDGMVTLSDLFDGAGAAGNVPVAARPGQIAVLDAGAVQMLARRNGLDWVNAEGVRRIVVHGVANTAAAAKANVEVLTYARSLATGDIVQPTDLVWAKVAAAPGDAPSDAEQVIGLAAKRPLRAGAAVSARDISAPQVIKIGDIVTVTYEAEGIALALQGKAMTAAAQGDTVMIQNTTSKKLIQAMASGPGQALIGPQADRMKAAPRSQIALR
jgi:flagella basal body P-ring formation protein FlgA